MEYASFYPVELARFDPTNPQGLRPQTSLAGSLSPISTFASDLIGSTYYLLSMYLPSVFFLKAEEVILCRTVEHTHLFSYLSRHVAHKE
jgi:hypothetical protein